MKKILLFFLFLLTFSFFLTKTVLANDKFSTDYNVTYQVLDNADTKVRLDIVLTNLSAKYYSPSYKITVGFKDIFNVSASDANGPLKLELNKNSSGTDIAFDFNKAVTGEGNKQVFSVEFNTDEVAQSYGNVWDINIPGISQGDNFSSFNATVTYPSFLGKPAFIKPNIPSKNNVSGNKITFSKDELGQSGISLAFGSSQIYEFNLKYNLKNTNLFPISTEIALPPNTNYQDVVINSIAPRPDNVTVDKDGNWLAKYTLTPSKSLTILVNGKANVLLEGKEEYLSTEQLKLYTQKQKYWETNALNIKKKASELNSPQEIYQFVVGALSYDFERASLKKPRLGASGVLKDTSSAVCLEFTDLFVTLLRAKGIPARGIDGYAITTNSGSRPLSLSKDVLHAWPEYYDNEKKKWIMVDPTWGNTTLGVDYFNTFDFDHIAFAIHGEASDYPVPAGGYKTSTNNEKDVDVNLSNEFKQRKSFDVELKTSQFIFPIIGNKGELIVKNTGNALLSENTITFESSSLLFSQTTYNVPEVPPFGYVSIPISFTDKTALTSKIDRVKILYAQSSVERELKLQPFYLNLWFLGGVLIVILSIIISFIARRSRRIHLSK